MPRKSAGSTAGPATTDASADTSLLSTGEAKSPTSKTPKSASKKDDGDTIGIDELLLPRSLVSRLARGILPANTSLQKDAVLALTKSATVFISYLASHANELTTKKTITSADVFRAFEEVELAQVMRLGELGEDGKRGGWLERQVEEFEERVRGKRKGYREKVRTRESEVNGGDGGDGGIQQGGGEEGEERGEPEMKKVRRTSAADGDEEGDVDMTEDGHWVGGHESVDVLGQRKLKLNFGMNGTASDMHGQSNGHGHPGAVEEEEVNDDTEPEGDEAEAEDGEDEDEDPDDEEEDDAVPADEHETLDEDDPVSNGQLRLVPNGRDEIAGSEDESD